MKILRWVSVVLISFGGLTTIIAPKAIMNGISDPAVYDATLTIGKVFGMITIIGLLCGSQSHCVTKHKKVIYPLESF